MNKISIPALVFVLAVIAVIYLMVASMSTRDSRPSAQDRSESLKPADCENRMCVEAISSEVVRVTRGDITLHIPANTKAWPKAIPKEVTHTRASVCFPGPGNPPPCEDGISQFGFWLKEGALDPAELLTPEEQLARITRSAEGPIAGPVEGVSVYLAKTSRIFVLTESDSHGRRIVASCSGINGCRVSSYVSPGLYVQYNFPTVFISQWPDLDRAIRQYLESVRVID